MISSYMSINVSGSGGFMSTNIHLDVTWFLFGLKDQYYVHFSESLTKFAFEESDLIFRNHLKLSCHELPYHDNLSE